MQIDPGSVTVTLHAGDDVHAPGFTVACQRPDIAARLKGLDALTAVNAVPLLFSLCGRAQARAARLALLAAQGEATETMIDDEVAAEGAREHALRLLLDWPQQLGIEADREQVLKTVAALASGKQASWTPPQWIEDLPQGPSVAALLPAFDARRSLELWPKMEKEFAQAPLLDGRGAEAGAHARRGGRDGAGVRARVRARAGELADHLAGRTTGMGRVSAANAGPGTGRSVVETARGPLMHEIALDGSRIGRYTIVAPTEWNFHPRGALAVELGALAQGSTAHPVVLEMARHWTLALDPCVRWAVIDSARQQE